MGGARYLSAVRPLWILVLTFVVASAHADRLILIPTGKKISASALRYDLLTWNSQDTTLGWVGSGIGQSYDFEISGESFDSNRMVNGLDVSYNYTMPVVDFAPGVSVGLQDATNQTHRGRNAYLAVTYRFGNVGRHNQDVPTELTFGFWTRSEGLMFFGAKLPFSKILSLVAEHDSENLTSGFEVSPIEGGTFRILFRERDILLGVRLQARL